MLNERLELSSNQILSNDKNKNDIKEQLENLERKYHAILFILKVRLIISQEILVSL